MKFYAGIGSRSTPDGILRVMEAAGRKLAQDGWVLRSGNADGADKAFGKGAGRQAQIFLPWAGFNGGSEAQYVLDAPAPWTNEFVDRFHPAPSRLSDAARKLMARNAHQVFGALPPVDETKSTWAKFVLCYTEGGKGQGGTGQAIRIARQYGIQVFDLGNMHDLVRVEAFIGIYDN